jgi:hypothetical protein
MIQREKIRLAAKVSLFPVFLRPVSGSRPPPPPIWVIRNLVKYGKGGVLYIQLGPEAGGPCWRHCLGLWWVPVHVLGGFREQRAKRCRPPRQCRRSSPHRICLNLKTWNRLMGELGRKAASRLGTWHLLFSQMGPRGARSGSEPWGPRSPNHPLAHRGAWRRRAIKGVESSCDPNRCC